MTATRKPRTRKAVTEAIDLDSPEANVDVIDTVPVDDTDVTPPSVTIAPRKYLSHANCDHPTKGDAGKKARAACRKALRAMVTAEAV